jgi:hypothetical protein
MDHAGAGMLGALKPICDAGGQAQKRLAHFWKFGFICPSSEGFSVLAQFFGR